jgi:ABC-2 type transport system permease protein
MDAPAPAPTAAPATPVRINRWLPYWAVFQADVQQTLRSWTFRIWIIMSLLSATGYMLYRVGAYREAGIVQPASHLMGNLLHWSVLGSLTLILVLTVSSIASERGSMADSVLSRGISRYQYFMGKWHARLVTVLGGFLLMAILWLTASFFLLHEDLSLAGCAMALLTALALLAVVVSWGVAVSAIANSALLGVAFLWICLYGTNLVLTLLPTRSASPERVLETLPYVLRGETYDTSGLWHMILGAGIASCVAAVIGMGYFARRDV